MKIRRHLCHIFTYLNGCYPKYEIMNFQFKIDMAIYTEPFIPIETITDTFMVWFLIGFSLYFHT